MPQGMSQQMRLPWSTGSGLELSLRKAESIVRRWQVRVHQLATCIGKPTPCSAH